MECKNWDLMRENWRLQLLLTIYRWLCKSVYVFGLSIYVKFRIIFINFGLLFHKVQNNKKKFNERRIRADAITTRCWREGFKYRQVRS